MGMGLPPSACSHLPSDCSSPRKRGVAEGPGAELSLCYQKVSGVGTVRRWSGGTAGWKQVLGTCGGKADRARGTFCPFLSIAPFPSLRGVLPGGEGYDWPYIRQGGHVI